MPDQNSNQDQQVLKQVSPDEKKGFSPLVSIVGIAIVSSLLFVGGYFSLQYLQDTNVDPTPNNIVEKDEEEKVDLKQFEENAKNDQLRKLDLAKLNKGLESFLKENKSYPDKLEDLTPDHLLVLPLDPVVKFPYEYKPSADLKKFTLTAILSDNSTYLLESKR